LALSDLARNSEYLLNNGLSNLGPFSVIIVFGAGLLTSLGPCSLSLLPVTLAYLAGFNNTQSPLIRSLSFCSGIVLALVILGSLSGLLGLIFGKIPEILAKIVALISILMGLNLIGVFDLQFHTGPDPSIWIKNVPAPLAPISAGLAFGLAASPCTTPVLAVLLAWIAHSGNPIAGILLLASFGIGQVTPLIIAGTAAASIPKLLSLRPISRWVPPISGIIFLTTGCLNLLSSWI
tara:strand:- start:544 stop:1248 length:705 start_codon:yes stop_codon:yes gene_type:complete